MNYGAVVPFDYDNMPPEVWMADGRRLDRTDPGVAYLHKKSGLMVVPRREPYLDGRYGWLRHVSLSYPNRLPGWKDLRLVKNAFIGPDVDVMMVLPVASAYTNLMEFCHHLWEMPEPWSDRMP